MCPHAASTRFLVIDHKDGDESNGDPSNLRWLCKNCNTRLGLANARSGHGVRTDASTTRPIPELLDARSVHRGSLAAHQRRARRRRGDHPRNSQGKTPGVRRRNLATTPSAWNRSKATVITREEETVAPAQSATLSNAEKEARATFQPDPERWGERQPSGPCTIAALSEQRNGFRNTERTVKNRQKPLSESARGKREEPAKTGNKNREK